MTTTFSSTYHAQLQRSLGTNPSFDAILNHHVTLFKTSGAQQDFDSLRNGTAILRTAAQCTAYLAAYGAMHRLKLNSAFGQLSSLNAWPVGRAEVFDWGCGQGLASGVLLDYARHQLPGLVVSRFTLIEPSEIALSRAVDHVQLLVPANGAEVRAVSGNADALTNDLVQSDPASVKIHLFSNLLDMDGLDLSKVARTIRASQTGRNLFVCVSPAIDLVRDARLSAFAALFPTIRLHSKRTDRFTGQVFGVRIMKPQNRVIYRNEVIFSTQL